MRGAQGCGASEAGRFSESVTASESAGPDHAARELRDRGKAEAARFGPAAELPALQSCRAVVGRY